jgi:hypothetical protein
MWRICSVDACIGDLIDEWMSLGQKTVGTHSLTTSFYSGASRLMVVYLTRLETHAFFFFFLETQCIEIV